MKYALINIFGDKVVVNGVTIEVLNEEPPHNYLDCITLVDRGGLAENNTVVKQTSMPLPPDNPYYDPDNPNKLYPATIYRSRDVKSNIELHIWANRRYGPVI